MRDQPPRRRSGFSSLRAGLFDVGVRQGLPLPPLHTRAPPRTLTHAHAPLFADSAPVAPKCLTPAAPGPVLSRTQPLRPHSRARSPQHPRPDTGPRAEARRSPAAPPSEGAPRGGGEAGGGRGGDREGAREAGRAHTPRDARGCEPRSERRAARGRRRPPAAPCCAPWRTRAASCCPTPAACSRTPCPARPPSSTSNR